MALNEAARKAMERLMSSEYRMQYPELVDKLLNFTRQLRDAGKAEAKAEVLLKIFAGRGLAVSDAQRSRVLACRDLPQLDRWIDLAFQASSVDEVLA